MAAQIRVPKPSTSGAARTAAVEAAAGGNPEQLDLEASPLSDDDRRRVLSAIRLKLKFTLFVVTVLLALSAMIFVGVSQIFDWLTPSIRLDLQRKGQRGALELAQTTQLGMVLRDKSVIASAATDYVRDEDIVALEVLDDKGEILFEHEHGAQRLDLKQLFALKSGVVHDAESTYTIWAASEIEGGEVGRVVLSVSKARLEAGMQLRKRVLVTAAVGCLLAFLLCLGFVNLYIGPILRVTGETIVRLERTTEAALAATRLKSQFLANMSHEIRTPMNGITGVLDLLVRTALNPKQQRYVQTIETSARGLLTVIDDILDFSKLEAGKYVLHFDDFELRQMAQDVAELLAPKAHAKGIELVLRVDSDLPYSVHGDIDRLKQVVTNLLSNAIKFTDQGHVLLRISLESATSDALQLRFSIEDTGIGIAPEDQTKLFGVFSQVDGSLTRKHGGTGLGLAISKRLVEAMGGTIQLESRPGSGSTFWFTITTRKGQLQAPNDGVHARDARVLVLCKDEAQRETMCDLLERWGMRSAVAADAEQASALIMGSDPSPFNVAVVDGVLEQGADTDRSLFDLCTAEGLPIIRLLATEQTVEIGEGHARRINLTKPVRVSELYNGLVSVLDGTPLVEGRQRARRSAEETHDQAGAGDALVLVVDDNEINRLVAVDLLTELGYRSEIACNGIEAVEQVKRGGYAAILMDCQMPEMDGYEATACIRALPGELASVPIIALTAHAMVGDRDRVLKAGMNDYTAKPVRARALERVLHRWVKQSPLKPKSVPEPEPEPVAVPRSLAAGPQHRRSARPEVGAQQVLALDPDVRRSARVIELFLRAVPGMIELLEASVQAGDTEQLRPLAHKLKGSCLSLGAMQMAAACQSVEHAAVEGRIDAASVAQLNGLFGAIAPLLEQARTGNGTTVARARTTSPA